MNKNRLFLDIHAIQTLPPSNINRDDTGSPKTALYGGVRRARVSSQSWKKAMRSYFVQNSEENNVGVRTLEIVRYVADLIKEVDDTISDEDALKLANKTFNSAKISTTKDYKAKALFFLGKQQALALAKATIEGIDDKDKLQEILKNNPAVDIALFGRMLADDPSLNEDASAQVAHAISTHAVQNEYDFYTAIDDLSPEDNAGAGMLGNIEFNSSTLYRYANIALHELSGQLNDKKAVIDAVKLFIKAFANSLPTGKINSFANQTIPDVLIVTLRNDRPISLVTAFEKPVKSTDGNVIKSIQKLSSEFKKVEKFVNEPIATMYVSLENVDDLSRIGEEKASLNSLLEDISKTLSELV